MVRNIVIKCWSYDFELHMHAVYQNFSDKNNYLKHTANYYHNYFLFKKIAPVPLYLVYTFKQQLPSKTVTRKGFESRASGGCQVTECPC